MTTPKSAVLEIAGRLKELEVKLEQLADAEQDKSARALLNFSADGMNDMGVRLRALAGGG